MITVHAYNKKDDSIVDKWCEAYGLPPQSLDKPNLGFMAFCDGLPLVAGFLRTAEGALGIIEGLIASPEATGKLRSDAINAVIDEILGTASLHAMKRIMATTNNPAVIERAKLYGFRKSDQIVILRG